MKNDDRYLFRKIKKIFMDEPDTFYLLGRLSGDKFSFDIYFSKLTKSIIKVINDELKIASAHQELEDFTKFKKKKLNDKIIKEIIKLFADGDDEYGIWGYDTSLYYNFNDAIKAVKKILTWYGIKYED